MKTFDCTYGRHALVLNCGDDGPEFGRVDVIQIVSTCEPIYMAENYVPRHAK